MMSFVAHEAAIRLEKSNPTLAKILKVIDWARISKRLAPLEKMPRGQKPYEHLAMFKAILLAQWYSLSDPELEQSLSVRMDFIAFTELEDAPDETTLCRFRNKLIAMGLEKILFQEINRQLQQLGLQVKKCSGAVVDATLIESACRPRHVLETLSSSDSSDVPENATVHQQASPTNIEYSKRP